MRLLPYGDRAWLLDGAPDPVAAAEHLRRWPWPAAAGTEVVVGADTCLVRFHGSAPPAAEVAAAVEVAPQAPQAAGGAGDTAVLPVRYDGQDLERVAAQVGCSVDTVIALHTGATFRVAFLGFAPGFAYLEGLPARLQLPRRSVPRVHVPAGAVAIADRFSAVYPRSSPGGWHLLGSTTAVLFDAERQAPATLRTGMWVRFEAVP